MKTFAIALLISSTQAVQIREPRQLWHYNPHPDNVYTTMRHWNEDPHSSPAPMNYGETAITSTQARFYKEDSNLNRKAELPEGNLPGWYAATGTFFGPYNEESPEYSSVGFVDGSVWKGTDAYVQLDSDLQWHQAPDFGELDPHVVYREADAGNGFKLGGWTNPLSWTDSGEDDDQVVLQIDQTIRQ